MKRVASEGAAMDELDRQAISNGDLARRIAELREEFRAHAAVEEAHQHTVKAAQLALVRLERHLFGESHGQGLIAEVHRMGVQVRTGVWVLGVLGTATVGSLVAILMAQVGGA